MADMYQRFQKPAQQVIQVARFQFHTEQLIKSLGFRLANLIISVVQRKDDAKMKLLADPLEVRILLGKQLAKHGSEQTVVLLQRLDDTAGWKIQLGQTPAVVFHLFHECAKRTQPAGGGRRNPKQRADQRGLVRASAEASAPLSVETGG